MTGERRVLAEHEGVGGSAELLAVVSSTLKPGKSNVSYKVSHINSIGYYF